MTPTPGLQPDAAVEAIEALQAESPDAMRLARVASLAVRIEPHLLRRLRLELVPHADVGTEADLWFSDLVESRGTGAIVLRPDVSRRLRVHLARDPGLLGRAIAITEDAHRDAPSTLRLEEQVNGLALLRGENSADAVDEALRPAIAVMVGADRDRALEIARWLLRAASAFEPLVWRSPNAHALLQASAALLGGRRLLRGLPDGTPSLDRIAWALPPALLADRVELGVELHDRALRFVGPSEDAAVVRVPRTRPPVIEVVFAVDGAERIRIVEAAEGVVVDLEGPIESMTLKTIAGDEYRLDVVDEARSPAQAPPDSSRERGWRPRRARVPEPSWIEDACVQVETLGSQGRATAFYIAPRLLVTAAEPFRGIPFLGIGPGTEQATVLNRDDTSSPVLLLEPMGHLVFTDPARLVDEVTEQRYPNELIVPSRVQVIAVIDGAPVSIEADVSRSLLHNGQRRFEARVDEPDLPRGFLGAPVILRDGVVGVVTGFDPARLLRNQTTLEVTGSVVIQELIQRLRPDARARAEESAAPTAAAESAGPEMESAPRFGAPPGPGSAERFRRSAPPRSSAAPRPPPPKPPTAARPEPARRAEPDVREAARSSDASFERPQAPPERMPAGAPGGVFAGLRRVLRRLGIGGATDARALRDDDDDRPR
jgi:hypothetical protein